MTVVWLNYFFNKTGSEMKRIDEVLESMREQIARIAEQLDNLMAEGLHIC